MLRADAKKKAQQLGETEETTGWSLRSRCSLGSGAGAVGCGVLK